MNVDKILSDYNVFLTGGSGFVGNVILQRLLNVKDADDCKIFCLLRSSKKHASVSERLRNEVLKNEIFELSDNEIDDLLCKQRVIALEGELTQELLGLDEKSISRLKYSASLNNKKGIAIIHCAADIDFNRELNQSISINVYGTYQCIQLAKEIECKSFIHISTLYVNSREDRDCNVQERIYDQGCDMNELFQEWLKNDKKFSNSYKKKIKSFTSKNNSLQRQEWPNNYTFTKNMGENVVTKYCAKYGISASIIRLGIVSPIHKGKHLGWFMGNGGFVFLIIGIATGNITYLNGDGTGRPDFVPVDYTADSIVAILSKTIADGDHSHSDIYQCGVICNNETWNIPENIEYARPRFYGDKILNTPSGDGSVKYLKDNAGLVFVQSKTLFFFIELILYEIPLFMLRVLAYLLSACSVAFWLKLFYDICGYRYDVNIDPLNFKSKSLDLTLDEKIRSIKLKLIDKPYTFVKRSNFMNKARRKLNWFNSNYTYFVDQRWNFINKNIANLYKSLDNESQNKYQFDAEKINFNEYATESALVCFHKYIQFKKDKKKNKYKINQQIKNQLNSLINQQKKQQQQQQNNNTNKLTPQQRLELLQVLRKFSIFGGIAARTSLYIFVAMVTIAILLFFVF